ncbi:unnamed protein product [Trichobilharzia szidati]|nr:unnamed protein product [Trichobilharzia szidati]CAH8823942.1 unnamed protein product [Trichobilharzia szidati]
MAGLEYGIPNLAMYHTFHQINNPFSLLSLVFFTFGVAASVGDEGAVAAGVRGWRCADVPQGLRSCRGAGWSAGAEGEAGGLGNAAEGPREGCVRQRSGAGR